MQPDATSTKHLLALAYFMRSRNIPISLNICASRLLSPKEKTELPVLFQPGLAWKPRLWLGLRGFGFVKPQTSGQAKAVNHGFIYINYTGITWWTSCETFRKQMDIRPLLLSSTSAKLQMSVAPFGTFQAFFASWEEKRSKRRKAPQPFLPFLVLFGLFAFVLLNLHSTTVAYNVLWPKFKNSQLSNPHHDLSPCSPSKLTSSIIIY